MKIWQGIPLTILILQPCGKGPAEYKIKPAGKMISPAGHHSNISSEPHAAPGSCGAAAWFLRSIRLLLRHIILTLRKMKRLTVVVWKVLLPFRWAWWPCHGIRSRLLGGLPGRPQVAAPTFSRITRPRFLRSPRTSTLSFPLWTHLSSNQVNFSVMNQNLK